jgi:nephrocystin-3
VTLNTLGVVLRGLGAFEDARTTYTEAVAIYRELSLSSPDLYRSDLAGTLNTLGVVLRDMRGLEEARAAHTEALLIYRESALSRPEVYQPVLAMFLCPFANAQDPIGTLEDDRRAA